MSKKQPTKPRLAPRKRKLAPPNLGGRPTLGDGASVRREIKVPPELDARIAAAAEREGSTVSGWLRAAAERALSAAERPNPLKLQPGEPSYLRDRK